MSTGTREPSAARDRLWMKLVVGGTTVAFWTSAALWAVLVALSKVAPSLQEESFFLTLIGASTVLAMVTSGFLFWQERRASRKELRAIRRENRAIRVEDDRQWTPRAWLYGTACALSFFLSWYLVPYLFLSS